ncbi:MAG: acetate--CoA ligase family protein [Pseudomonadota bacterium]
MKDFFYPSSVVVVGVSTRRNNLGKEIARNLLEFNYDGEIHLVGTEGGVILGRRIHYSLDEVPGPVDLAVVLTPARTIPGVVEQCGRKGIPRIIVESGGFGEFGEEGRRLGEQVKTIVKHYGMRLVGPNCIGLINASNGMATPFAALKNVFHKGGVGIVAQSGGVALTLLNMLQVERIGYSKFAAIGNKLDVDENDLVEYLVEDPETDMICLYLESVVDGRRLSEIARRSRKPILAHKANIAPMSSVIARSHTQALANDDSVVDAAFKQCGIVRFRDMQTYMDFVKVLQLPRMKGRNLAIVSRSGGHAVVAADAAFTYGFNLPPFRQDFLDQVRKHLRANVIQLSNPLDLGDLFDFDVYISIIEHTLNEPSIDGVLFLHTYFATVEAAPSRKLLVAVAQLSKKYGKPVALCVSTEHFEVTHLLTELDAPLFMSPERAISALNRSIDYYKHRESIDKPVSDEPPVPLPDYAGAAAVLDACTAAGRSPLLHEAMAVIKALGLRVADFRTLTSLDMIEREVEDLPGPYAVKAIATGLSHKSDTGGVVLNLTDRSGLLEACKEMFERFADVVDMGFHGLLVQGMAPRRPRYYEVFIGGKRDPNFGPVVLIGYGGVFVEVFGRVAIRMAPVSDDEVDEMIDELPGSEIFKGVRGRSAIDRGALKDAVLRVAHLMVRFPQVDQIDINPVMVSSAGTLTVDCRIVLTTEENVDSTGSA